MSGEILGDWERNKGLWMVFLNWNGELGGEESLLVGWAFEGIAGRVELMEQRIVEKTKLFCEKRCYK